MFLRLLAAISSLEVCTAHYYDLLSGFIRDCLQDMQYSCNMSPPRASLLKNYARLSLFNNPHSVRHHSICFCICFLSTPVLLIQHCCLMAHRFLSFNKVIPRHPSDHLQFLSSFDHPLFCSMDKVPLYDILPATCEVPFFRTFVSFFTASW